MNKTKYKLDDVVKKLDVKQSVIKQWEKDFALGSKNKTGQKYFTDNDLEKFIELKEASDRKKLSLEDSKNLVEPATENTEIYSSAAEIYLDNREESKIKVNQNNQLQKELESLKKQLLKLREVL